ncbi:hypothetical protein [Rhizohabitans arisaemae]|uniref:hypothetical protein n=1 Tax=Rhizohabitans arisaemae TaxID=2720610 RepID=UPI0024B0FB59|nr:hypothetical protein [Rhizohabitans arisaemae]
MEVQTKVERLVVKDEDGPLGPAETLLLIEQQRAKTIWWLGGDPLLMYTTWGVTWLLGFGALFLYLGYGALTQATALLVLFGFMSAAMAILVITRWRIGGSVRGDSADRSRMYGFAWGLGLACTIALSIRLSRLLPPPEVSLVWAATSMTVVAILYIMGGLLYQDQPMMRLGLWVAVLNVIGTVSGPAPHALIMSFGAGGGFIVAGIVLHRRRRLSG